LTFNLTGHKRLEARLRIAIARVRQSEEYSTANFVTASPDAQWMRYERARAE
jgi:hypothetical protein